MKFYGFLIGVNFLVNAWVSVANVAVPLEGVLLDLGAEIRPRQLAVAKAEFVCLFALVPENPPA